MINTHTHPHKTQGFKLRDLTGELEPSATYVDTSTTCMIVVGGTFSFCKFQFRFAPHLDGNSAKMLNINIKPPSTSTGCYAYETFLLLRYSVQFRRFPVIPINQNTNCRPARCKLKWDDFHQSSVFSKVIIFSIKTLLGVIVQRVHHSLVTQTHTLVCRCTLINSCTHTPNFVSF